MRTTVARLLTILYNNLHVAKDSDDPQGFENVAEVQTTLYERLNVFGSKDVFVWQRMGKYRSILPKERVIN